MSIDHDSGIDNSIESLTKENCNTRAGVFESPSKFESSHEDAFEFNPTGLSNLKHKNDIISTEKYKDFSLANLQLDKLGDNVQSQSKMFDYMLKKTSIQENKMLDDQMKKYIDQVNLGNNEH